MKKLMMFLSLCGLVLVSCNDATTEYQSMWTVKNNTEHALIIKYPGGNYVEHKSWYDTYKLSPGGSVLLSGPTTARQDRYFNYYFERISSLHGEDMYWQILSEDDVVLRTWSYSDRGLPDQRFFDESSWRFDQGELSGVVPVVISSWLFEILPEDIQ